MAGNGHTFNLRVPPEIRDALVVQQYRRLQGFLPVLCLLIGTNAIAMTMALLGDLPLWQQLAPPAIFVAVCVLAPLYSIYRKQESDPDALQREMNWGVAAAAVFGLLASMWCINAFRETEEYYCLVAPVFIALSAIVCSTCMFSVPRIAITAIVTTLCPVAVKLMTYDNVGMRSVAVMLLLLALMQSHVILANFRDTVSSLVLRHRLDHLASTDTVTGIDNRFAFMAKLSEQIAANIPVAVIVADLDYFKQANDAHGHAAGDAILCEVARRLTNMAPTALSIARMGGDEFALLFAGVREGATVQTPDLAALRAVTSLPIAFEHEMLIVAASFGLAHSKVDGSDAEAILRQADLRLYRDKNARRTSTPRRAVQGAAA